MATTLQDKLQKLPADRRKRIEKRAAQLIAEEISLVDLRKAKELTQVRMAELLNIQQENVSRLERRSDMLISTMRSYIEAMGGKLNLIVEFPDRPPVALEGFGSIEQAPEEKVTH